MRLGRLPSKGAEHDYQLISQKGGRNCKKSQGFSGFPQLVEFTFRTKRESIGVKQRCLEMAHARTRRKGRDRGGVREFISILPP
mmetsp:Transcript_63343/g.124412  ORF Transcript_63343/g.124412 Transcript_63343/m.124412 type:complete len:84 (+) Transcript_63343:133-384(+)